MVQAVNWLSQQTNVLIVQYNHNTLLNMMKSSYNGKV